MRISGRAPSWRSRCICALQRYRRAERGPIGEQVCAENNVDFFDYKLDPIPTADKPDI